MHTEMFSMNKLKILACTLNMNLKKKKNIYFFFFWGGGGGGTVFLISLIYLSIYLSIYHIHTAAQIEIMICMLLNN